MKNRKIFVMMSVVALTFLLIPAGGWAGYSTVSANRAVLYQTTDATRNAVNASANIVYTLDAGDALAVNDIITLTLQNGALFTGDVRLLAENGGYNLGAGNGVAAAPLTGGANNSFASWRVVAVQNAVGTANTLTLNSSGNNITNLLGVASGANVDLLLNLKTSAGNVIGAADRSLAANQANDPLFRVIDAANSAFVDQTDTADVNSANVPYTLFTNGSVNGTATAANLTNGSIAAGITVVPLNQPFAASSVLYTLLGDFTGIAAVNGVGITGSDSAGDPSGGTAGEFLINAAGNAAYAVNTGALAAAAALTPAPQFFLDGTTSQAERTFSLTVRKLAEGVWTAWNIIPTEASFYAIDRNGSTRRLLNLPSSTDSTGDRPFVRITNPTARAGKVYGTLWDVNGSVIGTAGAVLIASLPANSTQSLNAADLEAVFGTWTGRARLMIDAELDDIGVMGLIRNSSGNLNNYSNGSLNVNNW